MKTVQYPLSGSRNATWGPTVRIPYAGPALPLAGAKVAMQIRTCGGAPGDALMSIPDIPFVDALVSGTPGGPDERRRLILSIPNTDLSTIPTAVSTGQSDTYDYDIRIAYADGVSEVPLAGSFTLTPGVTRP